MNPMKRLAPLGAGLALGLLTPSFALADEDPPTTPQGSELRSPGLVVGGTILTLVSAAPIAGGAHLVASSQQASCGGGDGFITVMCAGASMFSAGAGVFLLAAGTGMLAGGISMIVVGAQPKKPQPAIPVVAVNPGGITARWSF